VLWVRLSNITVFFTGKFKITDTGPPFFESLLPFPACGTENVSIYLRAPSPNTYTLSILLSCYTKILTKSSTLWDSLYMTHLEILFTFVDLKDLWFCMETGKLWEPPHLFSSNTCTSLQVPTCWSPCFSSLHLILSPSSLHSNHTNLCCLLKRPRTPRLRSSALAIPSELQSSSPRVSSTLTLLPTTNLCLSQDCSVLCYLKL
jgi:hypothetical protein